MSKNWWKASFEQVELEHEKHVLYVYLNRPEASNAFTTEMIQSFVQVMELADEDSDIRCIVISGRGKHFCAGGDVKQMRDKTGMFAGEPNELRLRYKFGIQKIPKIMQELSKPVVAMINGSAIGAGLDLACMCDIRIAADEAKFGETFAKLGLVPGDGGTYFLQRVVGFSKAMELTLTADIITSDEALSIGLISKTVSSDKLKDCTKQLVNKIVLNAPVAVQMAKRAIIHGRDNDLKAQLDLLSAYQGITQRTKDHFTGINSLLEKCQPDFQGK